jgi:hypothetical protein
MTTVTLRKGLDKDTLYKLDYQNKKLKEFVISSGMLRKPFESHEPKNGFRLLEVSVSVYSGVCPKVPPSFLQSAFSYFHHLHWITSQGRSDILTATNYKWIHKILSRCWKNSTALRYRTDSCDEEVSLDKSVVADTYYWSHSVQKAFFQFIIINFRHFICRSIPWKNATISSVQTKDINSI